MMDRDRKRKKSLSVEGYNSVDDDDDTTDASLDPNDPRKYQRQNHSEIEKRRRDKMNSYIEELSSMIPMCSAMNRKLDKLTVLRMAVQHMKSVRGSNKSYSEVSHKPSYISDDELKHLILDIADGFLFVVGCDRGRILYVSESIKDILHYSQSDLMGQSLFDILHPRDISKVKEQLSSSDLTPRERLIDAKTMMPVKTEMPHRPTQLCSGARRSFFCRMKCCSKSPADLSSGVKVKKDPESSLLSRKKKNEKNFIVIHCTGYLKSWPTANIGLEEDGEGDSDSCSLSCLVAVGRLQQASKPSPECSSSIKVRPMEYMSRHTIDGKFAYIDERATVILGYLPQEMLGTSVYEYYHQSDIANLARIHRKVLQTKEKVDTGVYRFKVKDGNFLHIRSVCFSFRNPWTKEVEYIVSTNSVVQVQEVTSSGQTDSEILLTENEDSHSMSQGEEPTQSEEKMDTASVLIPGLPGNTCPGAGRIGKQIAEELLDHARGGIAAAADSSFRENASPQPKIPRTPSKMATATQSVPHPPADPLPSGSGAEGGAHNAAQVSRVVTSHNGINVKISAPEQSQATQLLESVMQEHAIVEQQNPGNDNNDEAAIAFLMSLLEADAGLGGPVDFNDLPWPL